MLNKSMKGILTVTLGCLIILLILKPSKINIIGNLESDKVLLR